MYGWYDEPERYELEYDEPAEPEYYDLSTLDIELEKLWADAPVIDEPVLIMAEVYRFSFDMEDAA